MAVTVQVTGNMLVVDNVSGDTPLVKQLQSILFSGSAGALINTVTVGTTPYTPSLPGSTAGFVFVQNAGGVGSGNLTVSWTPSGGTGVQVATLPPGGALMLANPNTSQGVTGLSLVSNTSTQAQLVIGA